MIYLIIFIPFQRKLNYSAVISSEDISKFIAYGSAIVYILIVYNSLYLASFIWGKIILNIIGKIKQIKNKNGNND